MTWRHPCPVARARGDRHAAPPVRVPGEISAAVAENSDVGRGQRPTARLLDPFPAAPNARCGRGPRRGRRSAKNHAASLLATSSEGPRAPWPVTVRSCPSCRTGPLAGGSCGPRSHPGPDPVPTLASISGSMEAPARIEPRSRDWSALDRGQRPLLGQRRQPQTTLGRASGGSERGCALTRADRRMKGAPRRSRPG